MQVSNNQILNSANGNTGTWINMAQLSPEWSLHIVGLEAGGQIQVNLSNAPGITTPANPYGTLYSTITGVTDGAPILSGNSILAAWIQLVKVPGTIPTPTTVQMLGHIL